MKFLSLLSLVLFAGTLSAQTCSTSTPCYQVSIGNTNTLPQTTILWRCVGSAGSCSSSALATAITQQAASGCSGVNSVWQCTTFSQTKTPQAYNDPVKYGDLMNYAASGGGAAGPTSIITFQVPQAPAQALTLTGASAITTTGNPGPQ